MSRYLFVVPPLVGHINPTLAVAEQLARRGHQVAWAGHDGALGSLLVDGARIFRASDDDLDARLVRVRSDWRELKGVAALKFFWQEFVIPLGRAMLPGVDGAISSFRPDVVVCDQQTIAGPVAARRAGLPWVTSATTSAEVARSLRDLPKVEEWVHRLQVDFQRDAGIDDAVDLRFSERLVLCFSTRELVGSGIAFPGHYVFTGPAITARPPSPHFPWDRLDPDRRRVLVSLGSLNAEAGRRFFGLATEALGDLAQLIMVAPDGMVDAPPAGSIVCRWVPQLDLLPHLDAVVSHAGHNTVVEALAHGLPQVVAPIRDDQPVVAQQIEAAGAAIRVRFTRLRAPELRTAVATVLDDPSYRRAAERIQESFARAGGAATAADHLEGLVAA
jgi:MGT family glycosyltransferase